MREVPETPLQAWEPPAYRVDERGKVEGVTPPEPGNWGRWGEEDQAGTINLLTPERVAAAAALVRTGKRFALGLPIGGIETPGHRAPTQHFFHQASGDGVLGDRLAGVISYSDDTVVMALQATTQLDGLAHWSHDDLLYNGYWSGMVTARSGARRVGVHHQADGLVGRGVLLDVARHQGVEVLEAGTAVGPELLQATAEAQGVAVGPGDLLLVRTGWLGAWLGGNRSSGEPGVSAAAVPWLAERDVAFLATDTTSVEPMPPEQGGPPMPLHKAALRDLGLSLGEMLDLDELAADCAADGTYECFLVVAPLPVVRGVGSPINPIALK